MAENNGSSKDGFEEFLDEMGEEKRELAEHKEKKRLAKKGPSLPPESSFKKGPQLPPMPPAPKPEDPPAPSGGGDDEPEQPDGDAGDAGAAEEEPEEIAPPAEEPEPSVRTEPNPPAQTFDSDGLRHRPAPGARGAGDIKRAEDRVRKFKEQRDAKAQEAEQVGRRSDERRVDPASGILRPSDDEIWNSRHRRTEGSKTPVSHMSPGEKKKFKEAAQRDLDRRNEQFDDDPDADGPDLDR